MILVTASSLWCSLSVHGSGLRIEVMRFGLLIVLTIGLLSVAFRMNSHDTASQSRPPSRPASIPSTQPSAPPTSPLPTTSATAPSGAPGAATPSTGVLGHAVRRHPTSGQPVGANGQQILPVTGWDSAVKLGALALLLIGSGGMAVRLGTPRRQLPDTVQD